MPRNITVTLANGTQHVYANAPDDLTPEAVTARAQKDFGQPVTALDGGRKPSAAPAPARATIGSSRVRQYEKFSGTGNVQAQNALRTAETAFTRNLQSKGYSGAKLDNALVTFRSDPRYQALAARAKGQQAAPLSQEGRARLTGTLKPISRTDRAKAAGRELGETTGASDFASAFGGAVRRNLFGIPERLAAAGERFLPSAITGNNSDASYDEILDTIRARTDAQQGRDTTGNIIGTIAGSVAGGRAAAGALGAVATRAAATGAPVVARAGNYLQRLMTLNKGARAANAGKLIATGAAAGATQAAGEGSDPLTGAAYGAGGVAVLGGGLKLGQVVTRPFRDFLRLSSGSQILSRLTTATSEQLAERAARYRAATGAEPTLFELLPLADRNKVLKQAVVGRDNVVEATSQAIRRRANNLGPEMADQARTILRPQREAATTGIVDDLARARGGTNAQGDAALAADASRSPTDMLALRDEEARAIMAPHDNTPVVDNLHDLYPSVPGADGARVIADPEVANVIRSAAGVLRSRPADAGVNAGEIGDMITTLRGDLGKGGIEGRTAQSAIDHLQGVLDDLAPDAGAAARQMTDAYAARSRMAEGMSEGAATRLRDTVQVGTSRRRAREVRNAYDTPEGATGRSLGQTNRILTSLEGSPEDALRATVGMSRNSTGREIAQNVGPAESARLITAARAQDESAQALAAASSKAQSGGGESANAETLVTALAGLHPSSFITTKAGAMRKLLDMTYIPENRARTIVDMIFSQDPAMTRRAIAAVGQEKNGASFMKYLAGVTGMLAGNAAGDPAVEDVIDDATADDGPGPVEQDLAGLDDTGGDDEVPADEGQPVDPTDSPYAAQLQSLYDDEDPALLDLIDRVSGQESGNRQHDESGRPITSAAGAIGIMQVMPGTAPEAARLAGVPFDDNAYRHDPAYNKLIGIAYLSELLRRYDGDVAKATAAYNAGAGRVDAAVARGGEDNWLAHVPAETQDYVQRVA